MRTEDIPAAAASPWEPEANLETVGLVGKLGEEFSEAASRCCRILIQGLDARDPGDGRTNREHLEDEFADVEALILAYRTRRHWDPDASRDRRLRKYDFKEPWFNFLRSLGGRP